MNSEFKLAKDVSLLSSGFLFVFTLLCFKAAAETHYVNLNSVTPSSPYLSWAFAATNIQDAIDASAAGDEIVITNGVYDTGERVVGGGTPFRVAVTNAVTLRSVSGANATIVKGNQVESTINGTGAVRCVYLADGAKLVGFTLTKGATQASTDQIGGGVFCESTNVEVSNCTLVANSAAGDGGGAYGGTLNNCIVESNSARNGGGALSSILNNCLLRRNFAEVGGGASGATLRNCTVIFNSAANRAGGVTFSTIRNCIVYYNTAPTGSNFRDMNEISYCCTTPFAFGTGNFSTEPLLASLSHISANSPCRGTGSALFVSGTDIDGEPWANPPSVGCDDYQNGSVTGGLSLALLTTYTNLAPDYTASFEAVIDGRLSASSWDFGDGTVVSNSPIVTHSWSQIGDYVITLRAYNETYPTGTTASITVHVDLPIHYVSLNSVSPQPPYNSWGTAATNIQDAVDVAVMPGALVLVSNGVYDVQFRSVYGMNTRLAVTKSLTVQSINGPEATIINGALDINTTNGAQAVRCVYLTNATALYGFTLSGGATQNTGDYVRQRCGGGVWCESTSAVVSNCIVVGNHADASGAGAYGGSFVGCTFTSNSAPYDFGGGAFGGNLFNCTLAGNSAHVGGGAVSSVLTNCLLRNNSAELFGGGVSDSTLDHCLLFDNAAASSGGGASYGVLTSCILSNNFAASDGGGAFSSGLTNCTLVSNTASLYGGGSSYGSVNNCRYTGNSSPLGGGAYEGEVRNCIITANTADEGGGAYNGWLNNCTLVANLATSSGGGAFNVSLKNCILYSNPSPTGDYDSNSLLDFCCTATLPAGGTGNFTNSPTFVNQAIGDFHLHPLSPCVNAGSNADAFGDYDFEGNLRISGTAVDVGAYEIPNPIDVIFYSWLESFGLPVVLSSGFVDTDNDKMNNWEEWLAGTNPTNATSILQMVSVTNSPIGITLTWTSVTNRLYAVEREADLGYPQSFSTILTGLVGQNGTTTYTDTNAHGSSSSFYRVRVDN